MQESLLNHYRSFSSFTYPGLYQERLQHELPADIEQLGRLVKRQVIHKITLYTGREGKNSESVYGDMSKVPWYRQAEDDYFPTASAMLAELYRRDPRGFVADRTEEHKLIVTCRFVAILMASILKSRGIPARVRVGYAPYIHAESIEDHWINQYWHASSERWITLDADTSLRKHPFDPFDMPPDTFYFAANAWLAVREGRREANSYRFYGASVWQDLASQVICDFHCLMNNEITYTHIPTFVASGFGGSNGQKLDERKLQEIDAFAHLMQQPDENFAQLQAIWETNRDFRLLRGSLI